MLICLVLFVLLVGWGLKEGEIYPREAASWAAVFAVCAVLLATKLVIVGVIGMVLATVILVLKVFGTDIKIT